ncbi:MAG TPA: hypothetical protein VGK86_01280 [Thermoanaerobaculia bacterium]
MDFRKVIDLLSGFFEQEKFPFAVIGAFGLQAYGLTRATTDLDFVTDSAARGRLVAFLESKGYQTLYVSGGYSNHLHRDAELGQVDFVYVSGETSRRLFEGATRAQVVSGHELPVPRPEHLAAMKVQAMKNDPERRHQELADIGYLIRLRPASIAVRFGATSSRAASRNCTMRSNRPGKLLNLESDLPTTEKDVEAQRRLRAGPVLGLEDYLRFLAAFEPPSYEALRAKRGPCGDSPFELPP